MQQPHITTRQPVTSLPLELRDELEWCSTITVPAGLNRRSQRGRPTFLTRDSPQGGFAPLYEPPPVAATRPLPPHHHHHQAQCGRYVTSGTLPASRPGDPDVIDCFPALNPTSSTSSLTTSTPPTPSSTMHYCNINMARISMFSHSCDSKVAPPRLEHQLHLKITQPEHRGRQ